MIYIAQEVRKNCLVLIKMLIILKFDTENQCAYNTTAFRQTEFPASRKN